MPDNLIFLGLHFFIGKRVWIFIFLFDPYTLLIASLQCTQTRYLLRELQVCLSCHGMSFYLYQVEFT